MKLIWTDPSIADLRAIRDYIGRDSDYYAADLVEQLVLSVERLLQFPKLGRVVPETQDENIRELVQQSYRIIYRILGERIEILTIVHGSRDLSARRTAP
ncbi:MAG: type II toxin-antitoxin system RelE/ParE family toxin [Terriglobia bacterium]|jgi:addiction module RelE/StbE family toxin